MTHAQKDFPVNDNGTIAILQVMVVQNDPAKGVRAVQVGGLSIALDGKPHFNLLLFVFIERCVALGPFLHGTTAIGFFSLCSQGSSQVVG